MYSKKGYLKNSPDVNNKHNLIPGNTITMKGVESKVLGIDDRLKHQVHLERKWLTLSRE